MVWLVWKIQEVKLRQSWSGFGVIMSMYVIIFESLNRIMKMYVEFSHKLVWYWKRRMIKNENERVIFRIKCLEWIHNLSTDQHRVVVVVVRWRRRGIYPLFDYTSTFRLIMFGLSLYRIRYNGFESRKILWEHVCRNRKTVYFKANDGLMEKRKRKGYLQRITNA